MDEPISKSIVDRLPSAIKGLSETCQKIYICLRLRKAEDVIARQLNLAPGQAREYIDLVRNELSKAGQIDLIEDPKFVSIHAENPDGSDMPITSGGLNVDDKLVIKEFILALKGIINDLPKHQSDLLRLRYKYKMSAKYILGFCKKIDFNIIEGKEISNLKEQDIFYGLNTALKELLERLKTQHEEISLRMDNLKYIFEEIGIKLNE